MYYKKSTGAILIRKYADIPDWVKWSHHSQGPNCCQECLMLDGCWFPLENAPTWPHHPHCHCTLDPIDYAVVLVNAAAYSDYSKFDPYLFNTHGQYTHTKEKLFAQWGYTVQDAHWLQAEMEKQAREKYIAGDYTLGKLDIRGQRISIRISIPRKDGTGNVSFLTGWMVLPNGQLKLNTPYGGKQNENDGLC